MKEDPNVKKKILGKILEKMKCKLSEHRKKQEQKNY